MAELGIWASMQPMFDAAWGGPDGMYAARLGERRALAAVPLRSMVDAGVRVALGSDSPVTPLDPWTAIRAAVLHHNEAERLTLGEAFHAHTRAGFELAGRDGGTLAPGRPASYVVWEVPTEAPTLADGLPDLSADATPLPPSALRTVVDGYVAFDRDHAAASWPPVP
jgi:predicted amidohydrolase YtcJ